MCFKKEKVNESIILTYQQITKTLETNFKLPAPSWWKEKFDYLPKNEEQKNGELLINQIGQGNIIDQQPNESDIQNVDQKADEDMSLTISELNEEDFPEYQSIHGLDEAL